MFFPTDLIQINFGISLLHMAKILLFECILGQFILARVTFPCLAGRLTKLSRILGSWSGFIDPIHTVHVLSVFPCHSVASHLHTVKQQKNRSQKWHQRQEKANRFSLPLMYQFALGHAGTFSYRKTGFKHLSQIIGE